MAANPINITDGVNNKTAPLNVGENTPIAEKTGVGVHVDGASLSNAVTEEMSPELLHTPYDNAVTICGYPDLVLNTMLRTIGYRAVDSVKFDHFSVDQRKSTDTVTQQATLAVPAASRVFRAGAVGTTDAADKTIQVKVENINLFHETDQIVFKGISGYDKNGLFHKMYWLNGFVAKVNRTGADAGKIDVILTNATPDTAAIDEVYTASGTVPGMVRSGSSGSYVYTITIAANTKIIILGHALPDEDAKTVPSVSIPLPTEQYMQKFMTQANVTNVWLDSAKNVNWGLKDIKEATNREFLLETEKTYWFGHKSEFLDPVTNKMVRTTGGFFEQLFEEGVEILEMWKEELTDESLIQTMATIFVGNRGSERRNMLTGMDFASGIFSLEGMQKQMQTNQTVRRFTYDWNTWKLFNFTIENKPYSLFDLLGLSNMAVVFDKANIERCVFRAMDEDMLDLNKLMIEDSKVLRCCEISSIVVKQPKAHRIIVLHEGKQSTNPTGANDNEDKYAA